jgi:hypothetical protein
MRILIKVINKDRGRACPPGKIFRHLCSLLPQRHLLPLNPQNGQPLFWVEVGHTMRMLESAMHEVSRKKFALHEHYETPRTSDGIATHCNVRMKEAVLLDGTLICAACHHRPSLGHGTLMFVVHATDEEEPSWTALSQYGFQEDKITRGAAQVLSLVLCVRCEKKKTCQALPGAQGSTRREKKKTCQALPGAQGSTCRHRKPVLLLCSLSVSCPVSRSRTMSDDE